MRTFEKVENLVEFENIPNPCFASVNEETDDVRVTMRQRVNAEIILSPFALQQLMAGADIACREERWDERTETRESAMLYFRLKLWLEDLVQPPNNLPVDEDIPIHFKEHKRTLLREQVRILKHWLELRMSHCEKQRDARDDQFNPDTYIGQKLLLLDIREWLLGTVVE